MAVSPTIHFSEVRNVKVEKMLNDLLRKSALRAVLVGYWANENKQDNGADMATVARAHEFGVPENGGPKIIPQRSFLRSTVDENRDKIDRFIEKRIVEVLSGQKQFLQAMKDVGGYAVALVKKKLSKSREWAVPLSPKTVARRRNGSDQPLVDKGSMRKHVDYRIDME